MPEKTIDRRPSMHKAGGRYAGCRMETHQHLPPPMSLLNTVATQGGEAILRGGGVTVQPSGTGETCESFSLNIKS
jgi:hypothetical protein